MQSITLESSIDKITVDTQVHNGKQLVTFITKNKLNGDTVVSQISGEQVEQLITLLREG